MPTTGAITSDFVPEFSGVQLVRINQDISDCFQFALSPGTIKAIAPTGVTGNTILIDFEQNRIAITVDAEINKGLNLV